MDAAIENAATLARQAPIKTPSAAANEAAATKAAKEFEGVFISQFLGTMFDGIPTDGPMGGGEGEAMFRSMLMDQYSNAMEKRGGFGLATNVTAQLLKHQEGAKVQ